MSKKVLIVDIGNTATEFAVFEGGNLQEFLRFFKIPADLENIKCSKKGTEFDVVFKKDKKKYKFETKLLGKANIYNILTGIALGNYLGISIDQLINAVKSVQPVEHRLQLKKYLALIKLV